MKKICAEGVPAHHSEQAAYLASATVLGLCWLYLALSGGREGDDRPWARRVYLFSILTIFVLSVAMSMDFAAPPA